MAKPKKRERSVRSLLRAPLDSVARVDSHHTKAVRMAMPYMPKGSGRNYHLDNTRLSLFKFVVEKGGGVYRFSIVVASQESQIPRIVGPTKDGIPKFKMQRHRTFQVLVISDFKVEFQRIFQTGVFTTREAGIVALARFDNGWLERESSDREEESSAPNTRDTGQREENPLSPGRGHGDVDFVDDAFGDV